MTNEKEPEDFSRERKLLGRLSFSYNPATSHDYYLITEKENLELINEYKNEALQAERLKRKTLEKDLCNQIVLNNHIGNEVERLEKELFESKKFKNDKGWESAIEHHVAEIKDLEALTEKMREAIENYTEVRTIVHATDPKTGNDYCDINCFCRLTEALQAYKEWKDE